MEGETVIDPGTGESSAKKSRWTFNRISEQDKTMAEKMVGLWDVAKMYFLDGGEWKDSHRTGDWLNYMENGTVQEYLYNEISTSQWSVNGKTNDSSHALCVSGLYIGHIDKMYYGNDKDDAKAIDFDSTRTKNLLSFLLWSLQQIYCQLTL